MASFEEEAFARARQLNHARPNGDRSRRTTAERASKAGEKPTAEAQAESTAEPEIAEKPAIKAAPSSGNILNLLFHDRENTVILILLLLLMGEENSGEAVMTLLYLLS